MFAVTMEVGGVLLLTFSLQGEVRPDFGPIQAKEMKQ